MVRAASFTSAAELSVATRVVALALNVRQRHGRGDVVDEGGQSGIAAQEHTERRLIDRVRVAERDDRGAAVRRRFLSGRAVGWQVPERRARRSIVPLLTLAGSGNSTCAAATTTTTTTTTTSDNSSGDGGGRWKAGAAWVGRPAFWGGGIRPAGCRLLCPAALFPHALPVSTPLLTAAATSQTRPISSRAFKIPHPPSIGPLPMQLQYTTRPHSLRRMKRPN